MSNNFMKNSGFLATCAPWIVVCGALFYGFGLNRYPNYYVDEAFFLVPAVKAAAGGPFVYAVSNFAPHAHDVWAMHGPVFPRLMEGLFRIFGFSVGLSRLPNFVCGWLAVLLMVIFLKVRGFRYAGLCLAVMWCGDRALQELMYARMEGLGLLAVVTGFLLLVRATRPRSFAWAALTGFVFGFSVLIHPLCLLFAVAACIWVWYLNSWKHLAAFVAGGVVNIPLLLLFWAGEIRESAAQFLWSLRLRRGSSGLSTFLTMCRVLNWSRYWFILLLLLTAAFAVLSFVALRKRWQKNEEWWLEFAILSSFALVAARDLFGDQTHPYYIVYFSLWPMTCLAMLLEKRWKESRYVALFAGLVWCSSAAWDLMRAREPFKFYAALSNASEVGMLHQNVPSTAGIVTTPDLYSVPIVAGYQSYEVTPWLAEQQDSCHLCYLLMTEEDYENADYVARSNLAQRNVLYRGPAFPKAGPLSFPIVLLSPENGASQAQ